MGLTHFCIQRSTFSKIKTLFYTVFIALCLCLPLHNSYAQDAAPVSISVGVYQNPPSVFYDSNGKVQGFFIDVLEHIAEQEGWRINYQKDTWPNLVKRLDNKQIDMIAGMAYTPERDTLFDFTTQPVFINWGQVYVGDSRIQSILDLDGLRIAGLKDDIYTIDFKKLLSQFGLNVSFAEVDSYEEAMQLVEDGQANASILSRSIGQRLEGQFKLHRSPIVCCSKEVHYAAAEGRLNSLLLDIDKHISQMKLSNDSFYFQSLNHWYGDSPGEFIPDWLLWLLASVITGILLLAAGVIILRKQVQERTAKLQEAHDLLENRVDQRTAELNDMNQQLLHEVMEHRKTQKKLQHMARHDPLTGLPNRRWFSECLQMDINQARVNNHSLAVMFLDLDGFKAANDLHGHDFGDAVLVIAAQRIRDCLRDTDRLARLGGDEFIVILPQARDKEATEGVARKILDAFKQPFHAISQDCHIGVSIGISLFPKHGQSAETLLNHADDAMYDAKRTGRNQYTFYCNEYFKNRRDARKGQTLRNAN